MKHLKRLISALLLTAVLATAVFASAATIKDVPAKNWAYPYVSKMVDMDIMQTHDGGYFYPDLPTSRGEFVLYLWRAMDAPAIGVDAGFTDVSWDDPWSGAVNWAVGAGITNGVSSNMFAPNDPCTRAQIVTFLWRAAGSPAPKSMSSFTDVPADAFYAKAVAWAVENGITGGTGDGKFSPDATCTRAQSVTFLYRAAGSPKVSSSAEFGDVATNAYYADAVAWAAKNGITGGIGGGLFGSDNDCTRAQIVTFLYRSVK